LLIVYLGEHSIADVVHGLLIAEAVRRCDRSRRRSRRAVARAVE
jgi:hypothetical protein